MPDEAKTPPSVPKGMKPEMNHTHPKIFVKKKISKGTNFFGGRRWNKLRKYRKYQ